MVTEPRVVLLYSTLRKIVDQTMDIVGFTRDLTSNNVSKVTEKPVYFKRKPTLYLTSHPSYTGYKDYYNLLEP